MFEWNSFAFISLICFLMSSVSAVLTLMAKRRGEALLWGLICLLLSFWTFFLFLCFSADTPEKALFLARTLNYIVIFLPALLFHFCVIFAGKAEFYKRITVLYYCLSVVYFFLVLFFPEHFLHSPALRFESFWFPYAGPLFYIFPVLYLLMIGHAIQILMRAKTTQSKAQKRKIDYLLTTILMGLIGAGSSLSMEFDIPLPPYGILSIAFVVLIATYAILRHDLLDLPETFSLITARVLIYIIIFAVVVSVIKLGAFFDNLTFSNFQILIISMLMVFICELYALMKSRVQFLSDSMLTHRKMMNDRNFKRLISQLENASDFEAMLPLLRSFFEKQTFLYHYAWYLDQTLLVQSLRKDSLNDFERSQQVDGGTYQRILFSPRDGRRHDRLPASLRLNIDESPLGESQIVSLMNSEQLDQAYEWVEQVPQRELIALPLMANGVFRGLILLVVSQSDTQYADQMMLQTLCAKLTLLIERFDSITEESRVQQAFLLDKMHSLKTLASEVAHEMKMPLSQMDVFASSVYSMSRSLQGVEMTDRVSIDSIASKLRNESSLARVAIERGMQSIEIILRQVNDVPMVLEKPSIYLIQNVVSRALAEYVFVEDERSYVTNDLCQNFEFKGDQQLLIFVIFNLLKTALYQPQYPDDFEIVLSARAAKQMNCLVVQYRQANIGLNGHKGFANTIEDVMTTQLGIAYSYKAMKLIGGSLTYDCKENGATEICLIFPVIL